jgi:hypothetical protein
MSGSIVNDPDVGTSEGGTQAASRGMAPFTMAASAAPIISSSTRDVAPAPAVPAPEAPSPSASADLAVPQPQTRRPPAPQPQSFRHAAPQPQARMRPQRPVARRQAPPVQARDLYGPPQMRHRPPGPPPTARPPVALPTARPPASPPTARPPVALPTARPPAPRAQGFNAPRPVAGKSASSGALGLAAAAIITSFFFAPFGIILAITAMRRAGANPLSRLLGVVALIISGGQLLVWIGVGSAVFSSFQ